MEDSKMAAAFSGRNEAFKIVVAVVMAIVVAICAIAFAASCDRLDRGWSMPLEEMVAVKDVDGDDAWRLGLVNEDGIFVQAIVKRSEVTVSASEDGITSTATKDGKFVAVEIPEEFVDVVNSGQSVDI